MGWSHSDLSSNSVSRECLLITFNEEPEPGPGEVVQELRVLFALPEDHRWVPSTHIQWFIKTWNSSFKGSDGLSWPPCVLHTRGIYTQTSKHIHINENK